MKARITACLCIVLLISVGTGACSKVPNDSHINSQLQDKFNRDSGLQGKQLSVQAANGTVTLSGAVDNDAQREAAARYASAIPGVESVGLTTCPPAGGHCSDWVFTIEGKTTPPGTFMDGLFRQALLAQLSGDAAAGDMLDKHITQLLPGLLG